MYDLGVAVVVGVVLSSAQGGSTIFVNAYNCPNPGDGSIGNPYCSIQTAIDNAVDTDEIVVAPGTYFEAIDFLGKAITLRSSDGPDVTMIDGTPPTVSNCCEPHAGPGCDDVIQRCLLPWERRVGTAKAQIP